MSAGEFAKDVARALAGTPSDDITRLHRRIAELVEDRDANHRLYHQTWQVLQATLAERDEARAELVQLGRERDEARRQLDLLRSALSDRPFDGEGFERLQAALDEVRIEPDDLEQRIQRIKDSAAERIAARRRFHIFEASTGAPDLCRICGAVRTDHVGERTEGEAG